MLYPKKINKCNPPKLSLNSDKKDTNKVSSTKEVPKLNFAKVNEKYQLPSMNVEGMYQYQDKQISNTKKYAYDNFLRIEMFKSNNYDKLKVEVKTTRKVIKEFKSENRKNKDYYLKIVNQINSLKDNINKTDKKITDIEREYRSIGGIKPEFVSSISISELNVCKYNQYKSN